MERPRGVAILSVVFAAIGILGVVLGVVGYFSPYLDPDIEEGAMIRFFGLQFVAIGVTAVATSYGLWNLKNWARTMAIILCGLYIAWSVIGWISLAILTKLWGLDFILNPLMLSSLGVNLLTTIFAGFVIWYLARPSIFY